MKCKKTSFEELLKEADNDSMGTVSRENKVGHVITT